MRLSVLIPVLNCGATLGDQLEGLAVQTLDQGWEVIVADNGSTDATVAVALGWTDRLSGLSVIDASARPGRGAARNLAVRASHGDLLLFSDGDDVVQPGWAAAFVSAAEEWDVAAGALDYAALNLPGAAPPGVRLPGTGDLGWLPFASGANLAVARRTFEDVGGFAEDLVRGQDTDFCWRAQLRGHRFGVVPDAVVAHRSRTHAGELWRQHADWGEATVQLFRRHRADGLPASPLGRAFRTYAWLLARLPMLVHPAARREWIRFAGVRWGRLRGSVRRRTLYL